MTEKRPEEGASIEVSSHTHTEASTVGPYAMASSEVSVRPTTEALSVEGGEVYVYGQSIESDDLHRDIARVLLDHPWMPVSILAIRSFMAEITTRNVIPGGFIIAPRGEELAQHVNSVAGRIVIDIRKYGQRHGDATIFELRPADESERPDNSTLFTRFVDLADVAPPLKAESQGEPIHVEFLTDTTLAVNGHEIELTRQLMFVFNVLLLRRNYYTTTSQFEAYGYYSADAAEMQRFSIVLGKLRKLFEEAGVADILINPGQRGTSKHTLNTNAAFKDSREEVGVDRIAETEPAQDSVPSSALASVEVASPEDVAAMRKTYHDIQQAASGYDEKDVTIAQFEDTIAFETKHDRATVHDVLMLERLGTDFEIDVLPGQLAGVRTIAEHANVVRKAVDKGLYEAGKHIQSGQIGKMDKSALMALIGLHIGLSPDIEFLKRLQNVPRPSGAVVSYGELYSFYQTKRGGREFSYLSGLFERRGDKLVSIYKEAVTIVKPYIGASVRAATL